jgi:hypothetical protein
MPYANNPRGRTTPEVRRLRKAVADLLDKHRDDMETWLVKVADDDPKEAFRLMTGLIEYALPKLARTELVGDPDAPLHTYSDEQLSAQIAQLQADIARLANPGKPGG